MQCDRKGCCTHHTPRITQTVELTFILGDVIENKTYASISFELKGIGTNETKVWQTALNGLKPENTGLKDMFEVAETKIDTYYSENCRNIIAMSNTLSASERYDEAIASLMAIPDICSSCYADAMSVAQTIYQLKINDEGTALLSKAKNAWNANPDEDGAMLAICLLDQISINSSAFPEAEAFSNTIASKLSSDKESEWQQKIKQYNDEKHSGTGNKPILTHAQWQLSRHVAQSRKNGQKINLKTLYI